MLQESGAEQSEAEHCVLCNNSGGGGASELYKWALSPELDTNTCRLSANSLAGIVRITLRVSKPVTELHSLDAI